MKAKALTKILSENPNFDVVVRTTSCIDEHGFNIADIKINGLCDVGYSGDVILLDGEVI